MFALQTSSQFRLSVKASERDAIRAHICTYFAGERPLLKRRHLAQYTSGRQALKEKRSIKMHHSIQATTPSHAYWHFASLDLERLFLEISL